MSKAATQGDLEELHRAVAEALASELAGEPCPHCRRSGVSPAMLKVAVKFLDNNGIAIDPVALRDMQKSLSELAGMTVPFKTRN
jgi:hypothetical protein